MTLQHFIEVARKRGGDAKIVGNVVPPTLEDSNPMVETAGPDTWQEIAIVHYASIKVRIKHFIVKLSY